MKDEAFSLIIGSLKFNSKSMGILGFGLFLHGLLVGLYSIFHIENPGISFNATFPLLICMFVLPVFIYIKGIHAAEDLSKIDK